MILARFLVAISLSLIASQAVAALPVANAHADDYDTRYVQVLTLVTLDASGSYGVGCELSYAWHLVSRPPGSITALFSANTVQPYFIPDRTGDYVFELVVADSSGTSEPERMTVTASAGSPSLHAKNSDRWMELTPGLMERTLPQISLPGTHDSGAYWLNVCDGTSCRGPDFEVWWDDGEWLVSDEIENSVARDVARAHSQTILEQLNGGIRSLDLRVTRRGGAFYVYHGLLGRPLTTVLNDIRTFMEGSSSEFLVVGVSHLKTGTNKGNAEPFTSAEHLLLMQELVDALGPFLHARNGQSLGDLRASTLGQIVADGSRILLVYSDDYFYKCEDDGSCDFGPAKDSPHFERFWHGSPGYAGSYTDTVRMFDSISCPRPAGTESGDRGQFTDQKCKATLHAANGDPFGFRLHQTLTANSDVAKRSFCNHAWWSPACLVIDSDGPSTLHQLSLIVNPYLPQMLTELAALSPVPVYPSLINADFYQESAVVTEAIRLNHIDIDAPVAEVTRAPAANRYGGSFDDVTVTLTASDEKHGSGVAGIAYRIEGAQSGGAVICGAKATVPVAAKGSSRVIYTVIDKAGNESEPTFVDVRINQRCDFNGDHKLDANDRRGLLESLFNFSKYAAVGDLDADGRLTSQEWVRCFYMIPR